MLANKPIEVTSNDMVEGIIYIYIMLDKSEVKKKAKKGKKH